MSFDGIITDSFAGGGGASTGIEMALGRSPDIAINHDAEAIAMHAANHPDTLHLINNIWRVDPRDHVRGRRVRLSWFSPDCKHFSKAKGGKPVSRNIRDLAWVVVHWAKLVRPEVIMLENVEEFQGWGGLDANDMPDAARKGETFKRWVRELKKLGYVVEWRELRACDYGAPTIRKRLFLIARRDGLPIVWPGATHGPGLIPYRTAAECIDWSIDCPSIFLTKEEGRAIGVNRPLVEATMARIARGVKRYVIDAAEPFFVSYGQHGGTSRSAGAPLHTITASTKDTNQLVVPTLIQTGYGERPGQAPRVPGLDKPLGTIVSGGKHALVAAFLAQHNTGVTGHPATVPISTITQRGTQQALVAAHMLQMKGSDRRARAATEPLGTVTAGGLHHAAVRAFLIKYYGTDQDPKLQAPLHTATTKARFGLVMVQGEPYGIVDIGMRMLTPRELFRAQGFPDSYIIDPLCNGRPLSKTAQVRMCGNSVSPVMAAALVKANIAPGAAERMAA